MPKSSKKPAPKAVEVAAATTPNSLKKGKRQPEEVPEKKLSNKKQKNEVGAQGVIVKEVSGKNQKNKKVAPKTQNKKAVKKQESSDVSPSSDSEEEPKLGEEESGSEDEDINDSDEDLIEKKEESGEDAESDGDDDDEVEESDDDDDGDDDEESDVDEVSDDEMVDDTTKPTAEKKGTKTPPNPSQASGSKTLFVGNLGFSVEKADVETLFKDYGELVDVRIGVRADGSSRGFAHVEFATVEAAQKALEEKNGHDLKGRPVRLDSATEKGAYTPQSNSKDAKSSQEKGSGVKTVYVRGFDKSVEENDIKKALREHFSGCGEVTRISVPSDDDGGVKGFAYIDFTNNDAVTSAQELDQSSLDGYTLTVEEAKPRDGGGGRFSGGRGGGRRGGGRFGGRGGGGRGGGGRGRGGRGGGGRGGGGRGRGRW